MPKNNFKSNNLPYPYVQRILRKFVNKKEREKDVENSINDALKHEGSLQHDENEKPVTFVNKKQAKSIEHEDHVLNDENEEPRTFADNL